MDLFNWSSTRQATPQAPQAAPVKSAAVSRRTCPITMAGAVTGPTADLPVLVFGLDGKERFQ